ncbi:hypothetical protein PHYBOEH_003543 [Phytophthora boehmeriae]|uniref:Uncharacterized protein n=1 Tax=Phytophthora boehmeriae TaxID=109152 RepID=A0A8T1XA45_9STRA|nr:hypothetical protein PHYBOEH_003543 [Phytophthora boehmeriae]
MGVENEPPSAVGNVVASTLSASVEPPSAMDQFVAEKVSSSTGFETAEDMADAVVTKPKAQPKRKRQIATRSAKGKAKAKRKSKSIKVKQQLRPVSKEEAAFARQRRTETLKGKKEATKQRQALILQPLGKHSAADNVLANTITNIAAAKDSTHDLMDDSRGRLLPAQECGLKLLREVEFNMLDFGTLLSRHVRFVKSINQSRSLPREIQDQVLELTTEIRGLQQDLSHEINKLIAWAKCADVSSLANVQTIKLQRFHPESADEVGLLGEVKLHMMQLATVSQTSKVDRLVECENIVQSIAEVQDDFRYEMNKASNQIATPFTTLRGLEEQVGDGERTETDDEFVWLENEVEAVESEEEEWLPPSSGKTK